MPVKKVLVTGATGRTGSFVLQKLRQRADEFQGIGFARSPEKVKEMFGSTEDFYLGDIKDQASLESALEGCDALVILTSAVPQMKAPPQPGQRPEFDFAPGEFPENVDWLGQKNQIDAAQKAQVKQVDMKSNSIETWSQDGLIIASRYRQKIANAFSSKQP